MSDEGMHYELHLKGHRMSGRAVKYRILSSTQIEEIERTSLKAATKETSVVEYNADVIQTATRAMIVAVSEPVKSLDEVKNWQPMDAATLAMKWHELFTHKDATVLRRTYSKEHVVTEQELEAIMGGVKAVLAE